MDPGVSPTFGEAEVLFSMANYRSDYFHRPYDVTPDGQRFVMIRIFEKEPGMEDLIVVENWFQELRQKVAAGRP